MGEALRKNKRSRYSTVYGEARPYAAPQVYRRRYLPACSFYTIPAYFPTPSSIYQHRTLSLFLSLQTFANIRTLLKKKESQKKITERISLLSKKRIKKNCRIKLIVKFTNYFRPIENLIFFYCRNHVCYRNKKDYMNNCDRSIVCSLQF